MGAHLLAGNGPRDSLSGSSGRRLSLGSHPHRLPESPQTALPCRSRGRALETKVPRQVDSREFGVLEREGGGSAIL